jgi:hypothetical protein
VAGVLCCLESVTSLADVTPSHLRRFIVHLQERGHNPGGVKNIYGAVKALLNWYADEDAYEQGSSRLAKPHSQGQDPACA